MQTAARGVAVFSSRAPPGDATAGKTHRVRNRWFADSDRAYHRRSAVKTPTVLTSTGVCSVAASKVSRTVHSICTAGRKNGVRRVSALSVPGVAIGRRTACQTRCALRECAYQVASPTPSAMREVASAVFACRCFQSPPDRPSRHLPLRLSLRRTGHRITPARVPEGVVVERVGVALGEAAVRVADHAVFGVVVEARVGEVDHAAHHADAA